MKFVLLLLLVSAASAQEVCRHCPIDLGDQFPYVEGENKPQPKPNPFAKKWLAAEAIHGASIGFDIHETLSNEGRCGLEGNNGFPEKVGAKELGWEGAAEWGFGFGLGYLVRRVNTPKPFKWLSYMAPGYGIALHLRGGIEWYSRCH